MKHEKKELQAAKLHASKNGCDLKKLAKQVEEIHGDIAAIGQEVHENHESLQRLETLLDQMNTKMVTKAWVEGKLKELNTSTSGTATHANPSIPTDGKFMKSDNQKRITNTEESTVTHTEPTIYEAIKALLRTVWTHTPTSVKRTVAVVLTIGILTCLYTPLHIPGVWPVAHREPDVIIQCNGEVTAVSNGQTAYFFEVTTNPGIYFYCVHCGWELAQAEEGNRACCTHYCSVANKYVYANARVNTSE